MSKQALKSRGSVVSAFPDLRYYRGSTFRRVILKTGSWRLLSDLTDAVKGDEDGKDRRQGCGSDGRGIGDRRGDGQAFRCRGRERGILRPGRRARRARGGGAKKRRRQSHLHAG